jgi:hypothetical protein
VPFWKRPSTHFLLVSVFVILCGSGCGGGQHQAQAITVTVSPQSAAVGAGQVMQFTATVTNDSSGVNWSVSATGSASAAGTIDASGNYTAPAVTTNSTATITATSKADPTKTATATVTVIAPGVVTATANVQVANYTITSPSGATVTIEFGPDTNYGLNTWQQPAASTGAPVSIFVAGMRLNSTYHMRAVIKLVDGTNFNDSDHTFTTGTLPAASLPNLVVSTTPGATPQSGVELVNLLSTNGIKAPNVAITDLQGNVLWAYSSPLPLSSPLNPIKLLPNGHFLMNFSGQPDGANSVMQEVDLTGQVIWQMTAADLNTALAAATCAGCNITVVGTHHDFQLLPNGHLIVIASQDVSESGLTGFPNPVTVTGDVIIDLDQNRKPVWLWSTFDHLDVNRHPMAFPDWIHGNSIVYSPDDKALVFSMRHQNWVIKIDYNDGAGSGNILWKLGFQGDFTLQGGTDPIDWFSAQHDANVVSSNSSGTFQMLLFDNGNSRIVGPGLTPCSAAGPCESRVPLLQLDETAKTATIEWVDKLAPVFSFFGGSARQLQNGNIEFDECGLSTTTNGSAVFEVTKTTPPQTVWQMQVINQYAYRSFRIPSLYPGVQW